ncbi:MAG: DUF554 domain-containing protein [Lachnospiraceae bacterium]|nr:DUF554 domain-containing protein [Lachnospiraceae bacterium]MBQ7781153.1 DUF554 domain-containing protein [Lachnospiraceae bacterium]
MAGLGTIINVAGIIAGGLFGKLFGRFLAERYQDTLSKACGISVLFIGMAGALEGMLSISDNAIVSGSSMLIVISFAMGAFLGELLNLEDKMERFGEWLKVKTGNSKEKNFVDGFVTASLTVCIGAMAIVGSIQDGIFGDYSILATKAVLDFIIILVMTSSLGKGCVFSAIPVACFQGLITCLARFIKPIMTDAALDNLSLVGSILIFCVGINLVWGKKIRVANLLPAIVIAVIFAFLPWSV